MVACRRHEPVPLKILLLSAYAAQSHVHWQRSLQIMCGQWQWQTLTLPPRHFSWRVRGNPLYWALEERDVLEQDYQLLVATSMVDLATLRGLVPSLASVPTVLYFHENQFDYPNDQQRHSLLEAQMVSLYSALAADQLVFNSAYNRDTFMGGCDRLLRKLPDRVPTGVVAGLSQKSCVIPVPVDMPRNTSVRTVWSEQTGDESAKPVRLLWMGRFEHDKGGDRLLNVLRILERGTFEYELAVIGQQFRNSPVAFQQIQTEFSHRLVQFGYVRSDKDYFTLLYGADLVVSTAVHEFQGIAVLEAVASGCLPVVPDRQAYPEIYADNYRYESDLEEPLREAESAAGLIMRQAEVVSAGAALPPDVSAFSTGRLQQRYTELFTALARPAG